MSCVSVPKILMPKDGIDLKKWAVVACDQYTSQKEYWAETDHIVGDAPSTLRLTLPEVYLEDADVADRIANINETMKQYLSDGTLTELPAGFILTERYSGGTSPRRGLVAAIDLECYEYTAGSRSLVRPTEKTVVLLVFYGVGRSVRIGKKFRPFVRYRFIRHPFPPPIR